MMQSTTLSLQQDLWENVHYFLETIKEGEPCGHFYLVCTVFCMNISYSLYYYDVIFSIPWRWREWTPQLDRATAFKLSL